jgi:hypothetical protein
VTCFASTALADNVRPAYLAIEEQQNGFLDVTWKTPLVNGKPLTIEPAFSGEFALASPRTLLTTRDAVIERWTLDPKDNRIAGHEVSIDGLPATMTDVLTRIKLADGRIHRTVLRPGKPSTVVPVIEEKPPGDRGICRAVLYRIDHLRLVFLFFMASILSIFPSARRRGAPLCAAALIAGSAGGYSVGLTPASRLLAADGAAARADCGRIAHGLLLNTYRAFRYEQEETIYDELARSVTGDLLAKVYLQNRNALQIDEAEGATSMVDRLDIRSIERIEQAKAGGFTILATWDVYGSVRHWGHTHYRCNAYTAWLTIIPTEKYWKIADLQLMDEQRVM